MLAEGFLAGNFTGPDSFAEDDERSLIDVDRADELITKSANLLFLETPQRSLVQASLLYVLANQAVSVALTGAAPWTRSRRTQWRAPYPDWTRRRSTESAASSARIFNPCRFLPTIRNCFRKKGMGGGRIADVGNPPASHPRHQTASAHIEAHREANPAIP